MVFIHNSRSLMTSNNIGSCWVLMMFFIWSNKSSLTSVDRLRPVTVFFSSICLTIILFTSWDVIPDLELFLQVEPFFGVAMTIPATLTDIMGVISDTDINPAATFDFTDITYLRHPLFLHKHAIWVIWMLVPHIHL